MIDKPSDRGAAAKALVESLGGSAVETTDGMAWLKCYRANVPG